MKKQDKKKNLDAFVDELLMRRPLDCRTETEKSTESMTSQ